MPGAAVIRVGKPAAKGPGLARVEAVRTFRLHRLAGRTLTFRVAQLPVRVVVTVRPTFSPSQFGLADARSLGAQVSFAFATR